MAGGFISPEASMIRIIELDHKSLNSLSRLFHSNQNPPAAICQPIQCINVVDKNDVAPHLQLQLCHERGVLDTASIVCLESSHSSAEILGPDGEEVSTYLIQLCSISSIHLGICAVYVEGIAEDRVILWTNSCLQQRDIFLRVSPNSYPVEEVPICFVLSLSVIFHKVDGSEKFPQVSQ